ncbi:ribose transport system ATP-binding protein/rhamnose transport system ATP-binding protein [Jatrophihabitans endophyticus]|uniref:Ribose transport system ATP-binding protein/rhamnose transport system ATP-binding protein n=1 Tax=Jatrophihabitans endophyticus TaxID=1206085 RepID=A0A1M5P7S8_9ACTN|nr:sugar ABC transporter ATP-binding protein [Jatrophihabitans endophyticus]SHG97850.1 ribose transport system ATP-binding protein/rhamnose transport system ATP-binding protein [Jatrophihabitans endophyticus]
MSAALATTVEPEVPALAVHGLGMAFPGVRALHDVSLEVAPGQVHALLGENGAGKSTLIKIVTGVQRPHAGTVTIAGRPLRTFTPRAAQHLGVRVVHQERQIAPDLSVAHNILMDDLPGGFGVVRGRRLVARAQEELDRLDIAISAARPAAGLTAAEQQLVELVRAVHRRAPLVIMDEPTASLRRGEVDVLFAVIRALRREGTALLYISHHLHEVFEIADVATVLRNGARVGHFRVADTTPDELVGAMFDRSVAHVRLPRPERDTSHVAARATAVARPPVLAPTDVPVHRGEIVALCGGAGSGASDLATILAGAQAPTSGRLELGDGPGGDRVRGRSRAARAGVGFVPADRKADALLLDRPIVENVILSRRGRGTALYRPRAVLRLVRDALRRGRVKADDPRRTVATLSGGNQQRVVLARWLLAGCRLLVLDQPTAGVDIASKFEIYQQLLDLAADGLAILFVSSDYEEISCLADRVLVMRDGVVTAELDGATATPDLLYQLEMGQQPPQSTKGTA